MAAFSNTGAYRTLENAGEMGRLVVATARELLTPKTDWIADAVIQFSTYARRTMVPLVVSMVVFMIGYGVFFYGGLLAALGVGERLGGALYLAVIREEAVWVTTMIFAGVAGSAVAADLGARRIREELDALAVLGVDTVRSLVLPRVVAMTLLAPVMGFVAVFVGNLAPQLVGPHMIGYSPSIGIYSIKNGIYASDIVAFTLKLLIIGAFVGIVSCQKGLSTKGGAEGVGKSVHQTVTLTFLGIWVINSVFNLAYLTLFPETGVLKG